MTPERYALVKQLFLEVLELSADERAAALAEKCGDDSELRQEVERLVAHHVEETLAPLADTDGWDVPVGIVEGAVEGADAPTDVPARPHVSTIRRDFQPGTIVAERYRIVALAGRGGMGEVYRADDLKLQQTVALKFLPTQFAEDPQWLVRLHREVRLAREVTHPNVCRVFDIGESGGDHFICMEYIDGEDSASLLKRIGRLPRDKAIDISRQLCGGLAAAHGRHVLHLDLKPANVMLDNRGQVRITDFGLAALAEEVRDVNGIAGTPAYMAPEQITGQQLSEKTDIYSLGLVLYELFTGKPAFEAASYVEYIRQHQSVRPSLPSKLIEDMDPRVERVILQCMEKRPDDRPASAIAVAAALPGVDALALVVEAGQTPSPETVAEAGASQAVSVKVTTWAGIVAAALFISLVVIKGSVPSLSQVGRFKSPAVLLDTAQKEVASLTGSPAVEPRDFAYGFCVSEDCLAELLDSVGASSVATTYLWSTREDGLLFWYRQGDDALVPQNASNVLFDNARVTLSDPEGVTSGRACAFFDETERMVAFALAPPRTPDAVKSDEPTAWGLFLEATGFPNEELVATEPTFDWPGYAMERSAWRPVGKYGDDDDLYIEAAAVGHSPAFFAVFDPLGPDESPGPTKETREAMISYIYAIVLFLATMVALPIARRNLMTGRGDRNGALRVAQFVFYLRLVVWCLQARHVASIPLELQLLCMAVLVALGEASLLWVFYIALEPYVRRYWPQTIASWARLIRWRWRDSLVAQHVLVGVAGGLFWVFASMGEKLLIPTLRLVGRRTLTDNDLIDPLLSARSALAICLDGLRDAVFVSLLLLMILVALRALLRRPLWAAIVAGVIVAAMTVPRGGHVYVSWFTMGVCTVGVALVLVIRFGLVALAVAVFVHRLVNSFPITLDFAAWFADKSLFVTVLVAAMIVVAWWAARRPPVLVR